MQNITSGSFKYSEIATFNHGLKKRKLISKDNFHSNEKKLFKAPSINELISSFSSSELDDFSSRAKSVTFSAGDSIYRHGDNIHCVYFPVTAVFSQFQVLEDGRTCEIAMIGREGCVGLSGVIAPKTANCWTEVSVAGQALKIETEVLRRELQNNSILQAKIIEYQNFYAEQLSQRIVCNYFHQVKERFCSWLLMLQERRGESKFIFTQEGIARMLGVHRPSLSCVAKELQKQNLISYSRGKIEILNHLELQHFACVCGSNLKHNDPAVI